MSWPLEADGLERFVGLCGFVEEQGKLFAIFDGVDLTRLRFICFGGCVFERWTREAEEWVFE